MNALRHLARRLCLAATACLLTALFAPMAPAADADERVEFPVWTRAYAGTLGGKPVKMTLSRVAGRLDGNYCYEPCAAAPWRLALRGSLARQGAELDERDSGNAQAPTRVTGRWKVARLDDAGLQGSWRSPDGKRDLPLALTRAEDGKPFPYEIRLVADSLPADTDDCADVPTVSAIRLYRDGRLAQTLETESQGTCTVFTPEIADMNFDGWPDIGIAQSLPAGPNIPTDMWLYEPAGGRFVQAPPALLEITSPNFDAAHQRVWSFWRGSCCDHGIDVYRWQGNKLEAVERGESYYLPVRQGGALRYCYVMPDYEGGHVVYPGAVWERDGKLTLGAGAEACEPVDAGGATERVRVDVFRDAGPGAPPVKVRSEAATYRRLQIDGQPMHCAELPVFESGRIRRVQMKDVNWCVEPEGAGG